MRGPNVTCPKCSASMPVDYIYCGKCGTRLATGDTVEGETKQVTVLFAYISGFTALAERLDPEGLPETMRTAWAAIAAEIRGQGALTGRKIGDAGGAASG